MIYQAARWRKKPGGGRGAAGGSADGGGAAALAMINRAANKGDDITSGDSGLVRVFPMILQCHLMA